MARVDYFFTGFASGTLGVPGAGPPVGPGVFLVWAGGPAGIIGAAALAPPTCAAKAKEELAKTNRKQRVLENKKCLFILVMCIFRNMTWSFELALLFDHQQAKGWNHDQ